MRPQTIILVGLALLPLTACGSESTKTPQTPQAPDPPPIVLYKPIADEDYPAGKRLAARIAQRALTHEPGSSARAVARSLGPSAVGIEALTRTLRPIVEPDSQSSAKVIYPQLSGVTSTSLGVMVVVRQSLEDADGDTSSLTRVVDVRLRRSNGPWFFDRIGSLGGSAVERPGSLSSSARRVLDDPNIQLSDSARWDIYRGAVDPALLETLVDASRLSRLSVSVIDSGHPANVWATSRPSAHSVGFAVDIWAVDGVPVISQRETGSAAYELASSLVAGGAYQLGSPWILGSGSAQSFTDDVHQDHIHLQQAPVQ